MSIWVKLALGAFLIALAGGLVLEVKHTFTVNGELRTQLQQAADEAKAQGTRITQLEADSMAHAKTLQALTDKLDEHSDKIAANAKQADSRAAYIAKTYAGANNVTKSVLDTDLPEFRCVFNGSCETDATDAPAGMPPAKH